jgi:hypothetical protein
MRTMIKEGANSFLFCFFDFGNNMQLQLIMKECEELLILHLKINS